MSDGLQEQVYDGHHLTCSMSAAHRARMDNLLYDEYSHQPPCLVPFPYMLGTPTSLAVASSASRHLASGPEALCAAVDYSGVVEPAEGATHEDITAKGQGLPKGHARKPPINTRTRKRKMQLAADGGWRSPSTATFSKRLFRIVGRSLTIPTL